jgi:hypothetical protein
MGLASPERYVWSLRHRVVQPGNAGTNYLVFMRNFDPVNLFPSKYINGILYTYSIAEYGDPDNFSDAVERSVDPFLSFNSVVSGAGRVIAESPFGGRITSSLDAGIFYIGLTRDDIGGLRYLYAGKGPFAQINVEQLIAGTVARPGTQLPPWAVAGVVQVTNGVVDVARRPGVDKIVFKQIKRPITSLSLVTNNYTDIFINPLNNRRARQNVQRISNVPDILFTARDLGTLDPHDAPVLYSRSFNPLPLPGLNSGGTSALPGPGILLPQIEISFSKVGPWIINRLPNAGSEANPFETGWVWGSFDGTTNVPIVFPHGLSISVLEQQVLNQ